MKSRLAITSLLVASILSVGCGSDGNDREAADAGPRLGPADGLDLPPVDTGRVQVGDVAPDFSLMSYAGDVVTLSDYRESKDVVLVFYRGHW